MINLKAIRKAYKEYLAQMLTLAGEKNPANIRADAIFAMEKKIAQVQWTREDSSDATKTYNKMTLGATRCAITPGLKLSSVLTGVSPKITEVVVGQPSAITGIAKIFAETDLAVLKDQMIVNSLATYLECAYPIRCRTRLSPFTAPHLQGTPQARTPLETRRFPDRGNRRRRSWQSLCRQIFSTPETKASMDILGEKCIWRPWGAGLTGLSWMQPETKAKARTKLANFTTKIGYPDRWKDYSKLKVVRGDLFGNDLRVEPVGL